QPVAASGIDIPGYYNLPDRGQRLNQRLADDTQKWDQGNSQALQLDTGTGYGPRLLAPILDELRQAAADDQERALLEQLAAWNGVDRQCSVAAPLFNQQTYQLARVAVADALGAAFFDSLLLTRVLDRALPTRTASPEAPWWRRGNGSESRAQIVASAWRL